MLVASNLQMEYVMKVDNHIRFDYVILRSAMVGEIFHWLKSCTQFQLDVNFTSLRHLERWQKDY